jgi:hypothetical protein
VNDAQLESHLRSALDEYAATAPLPNRGKALFRHPGVQPTLAGQEADRVPKGIVSRIIHSRPAIVVALVLGLGGSATGIAAASGAFDQSPRHVALGSMRSLLSHPLAATLPEAIARSFRPPVVV